MSITTHFTITLAILYVILALIVWSIARPKQRVWPPPGRKSWQYHLYWWLFYAASGLSLWLIAREWNSWC